MEPTGRMSCERREGGSAGRRGEAQRTSRGWEEEGQEQAMKEGPRQRSTRRQDQRHALAWQDGILHGTASAATCTCACAWCSASSSTRHVALGVVAHMWVGFIDHHCFELHRCYDPPSCGRSRRYIDHDIFVVRCHRYSNHITGYHTRSTGDNCLQTPSIQHSIVQQVNLSSCSACV